MSVNCLPTNSLHNMCGPAYCAYRTQRGRSLNAECVSYSPLIHWLASSLPRLAGSRFWWTKTKMYAARCWFCRGRGCSVSSICVCTYCVGALDMVGVLLSPCVGHQRDDSLPLANARHMTLSSVEQSRVQPHMLALGNENPYPIAHAHARGQLRDTDKHAPILPRCPARPGAWSGSPASRCTGTTCRS